MDVRSRNIEVPDKEWVTEFIELKKRRRKDIRKLNQLTQMAGVIYNVERYHFGG